jgi:arylsulfatase A-like enzyme
MQNIHRRKFLSQVAGCSGALLLSSFLPVYYDKSIRNKPNIIFILIDDLGWKDLSCYGSKFYETPAIDNLAEEGVRFTQAYCAHPRCVPSRFSIMSGKFPARYGVPGKNSNLPIKEFTVAEALKEGGYKTFFAGKWHLGKENNPEFPYPEKQGFDINIAGHSAGAPGSYFYPYKGNRKTRSGDELAVDVPGLEGGKQGEYLTDRLTSETTKFIQRTKDQPFFVFLSHYAVHTPLQAKEDLAEKYEQKLKSIPAPTEPAYIKEGVGETKMRQDHPVYAGMIQSVDESLSQIMKTLEGLSLTDNTIIIFTSDNGGLSNRGSKRYRGERDLATSNFPLRAGKGWCYEGGIRVPLIVKWPGVTKPGSESNAMVTGPDYYPTILEMTGQSLRPEQHLDGISFRKVLIGEQESTRHQAFWHSPVGRPDSTGDENCSVIRDGDYKLIDWYDEGRVELYHINSDFEEQHDLSKTLPEKTDELYKKLVTWRKEVNAYIRKK